MRIKRRAFLSLGSLLPPTLGSLVAGAPLVQGGSEENGPERGGESGEGQVAPVSADPAPSCLSAAPLNVTRFNAATQRREDGILTILAYETECEGWPVRVLYTLYLRRRSGLVPVLAEVSGEIDPAAFLDDYNAAHDDYQISLLPGYHVRPRAAYARIQAWVQQRRETLTLLKQP